MSLRGYAKNLGKNNNGYEYAQSNRNFWFNFYFDFFRGLITNYFEYINLPPTIDRLWLEKHICFEGYVGVYVDPVYGLTASRGAMGTGLDQYDNPIVFKPVNNSLYKAPSQVFINWYDDILDPSKAVIIPNNNYFTGSFEWLNGFCSKLADIEQAIQLNRNAQLRPFIVIAESSNVFSMKNFINKILHGDPVVYVNKQKSQSDTIDPIQLEDMVHVLNTKTEYLLDKLHDEKQRVINQFLTTIGINNNAVDKAERLVAAEATSNNGLINACIRVNLNAREQGIERINRCWGPNGVLPMFDNDIIVRASKDISIFNTETVLDDLNTKTEEVLEQGGEASGDL